VIAQPGGIWPAPVKAGDVGEVSLQPFGVLRNPVAERLDAN
jgi:hypothetical protein